MAGHVPRRLLKQPDIDKCLLAGTTLWKWDEVCVCVCVWCVGGQVDNHDYSGYLWPKSSNCFVSNSLSNAKLIERSRLAIGAK